MALMMIREDPNVDELSALWKVDVTDADYEQGQSKASTRGETVDLNT
jgi:hypothetical protein